MASAAVFATNLATAHRVAAAIQAVTAGSHLGRNEYTKVRCLATGEHRKPMRMFAVACTFQRLPPHMGRVRCSRKAR